MNSQLKSNLHCGTKRFGAAAAVYSFVCLAIRGQKPAHRELVGTLPMDWEAGP